jgi:hypothetical protein
MLSFLANQHEDAPYQSGSVAAWQRGQLRLGYQIWLSMLAENPSQYKRTPFESGVSQSCNGMCGLRVCRARWWSANPVKLSNVLRRATHDRIAGALVSVAWFSRESGTFIRTPSGAIVCLLIGY